jgi:hypothetical protein
MEDEITKQKLRKNTMRSSGISALKKIRGLVDDFDQQERSNRKKLKIWLIISIIAILFTVYYFYTHEPEYQYISLLPDTSAYAS